MTETYRAPKTVRASAGIPATLTLPQVLALRDADGEAGDWARRIAAGLEQRAATIEEAVVTTTQIRAEGADIPLADALASLLEDVFEFYCRAHEEEHRVTARKAAGCREWRGPGSPGRPPRSVKNNP